MTETTANTEKSPDEHAIRDLVERWMEASRRNDLPTLMDLMSDDVIFITPGQQPFGKSAFAAASAGMSKMSVEGTAHILELQMLGDWAYLRNQIAVAITPQSEETARHFSGHTLTILRKEGDGKWRVIRDANLVMPV